MLSTAAQFTTRARPLNAVSGTNAARLLRASTAAGARHHKHTLSRPDLLRKCHGAVSHHKRKRYGVLDDALREPINRVNHLQRLHTRLGGLFGDDGGSKHKINSQAEKQEDIEHGQHTQRSESAEREAFTNSSGRDAEQQHYDLHTWLRSILGCKENRTVDYKSTSYDVPAENEEYFIDPITNRKVAKHPSLNKSNDDTGIPVKTSKDYMSQLFEARAWARVHGHRAEASSFSDIRRTVKEIVKDRQTRIDADSERNKGATIVYGRSQPAFDNDRHVRNGGIDVESKRIFFGGDRPSQGIPNSSLPSDAQKYKSATDELDVSSGPTLFNPEELDRYKPVVKKETVQFDDLKPQPDDLASYKSAIIDEISARFKDEKMPYSDLDRYKSVENNDPSVKPAGYVEQTVEPEALARSKSFVSALQPGDFPKKTVEELHSKYGQADVKKYTAVRYLEPVENRTTTEDTVKNDNAEEPAKYQPSPRNEPNSKPPLSKEEISHLERRNDLARYQGPFYWNEPDGKLPPSKEELSHLERRNDLARYQGPFYWNEPDGKLPPSKEELSHLERRNDLARYQGPFYWNEPDGKLPPSKEELSHLERRNDLARYQRPFYWNEPDGQPLPSDRESNNMKRQKDPTSHGSPVLREEPGAKSAATNETPSHSRQGYFFNGNRYASYQKSDEKPAAHGNAEVGALDSASARKDNKSPVSMEFKDVDNTDKSESEVSKRLHVVSFSKEATNDRKMPEPLVERQSRFLEDECREASVDFKSAKAKARPKDAADTQARKITGNYVQDFPEEFEKSWTKTLSSAPEQNATYETKFQSESQNMDGGLEGGFGRPTPIKVQPALARTEQPRGKKFTIDDARKFADTDFYSKEPRGLQTSYTDECGGKSTQPLFVRTYGSLAGKDTKEASKQEAISDSSSGSNVGPTSDFSCDTTCGPTSGSTIYKILAYDAKMQKINIAETTSFVPEQACALTPTDALLRLSHPSQFFPHFAALEAEGFEIVSGSSDVLVFRKVRPSTEKPQEEAAETQDEVAASGGEKKLSVNPIDMTGRPKMISPASANFASPTGYVNYDFLPESKPSNLPPPPPHIKYNIDLRREEPVFSGPKYKAFGGEEPKKGLGKRLLVGGIWFAGISYGLGVVSEYLTTGGTDGMGPTGF